MRKQLFANVLTSVCPPPFAVGPRSRSRSWILLLPCAVEGLFVAGWMCWVGLRTRCAFGSGCHEQSQPSSFTSIGVLDLRQPRLATVYPRGGGGGLLRGGGDDDVQKPSSQLCYTRARRTPLTATQSLLPAAPCRRRPLQLFLRLCGPAACWNTARCADSHSLPP